jgi:hypothetical protein
MHVLKTSINRWLQGFPEQVAGSRSVIRSGLLAFAVTIVGAVAVSAQNTYTTPYAITTFAGKAGVLEVKDGSGTNAHFIVPIDIAIDSQGNLFVTERLREDDEGNSLTGNVVRKITATGTVTTFAGSPGVIGSADGTGATAEFAGPAGIAIDQSDNLYIVDEDNCTIRKITPTGHVTTFAGTAGQAGSRDGVGAAARFNEPMGIAVDAAGNVYVADHENNTIRKITPSGVVTTLAGKAGEAAATIDGTGSQARFCQPIDVALDSAGNAYVTEDWDYGVNAGRVIRKITQGGVVTTLAGSPGQSGAVDGAGTQVRFDTLAFLAADAAGNLFVADIEGSTIRKISAGGVVSTLAGSNGEIGSADGTGRAARFYGVAGIAVAPDGTLYIADAFNGTIRKGVLPTSTGWSQFAALSARAPAGTGEQTLILGFVFAGGGKPTLVRGVGPNMSASVSGYMRDPQLTLYTAGGSEVARNDNWGGTSALSTAFAQTGAGALSANSKDAALLETLTGNVYTAHVSGVNGTTGVALAEAFDAALSDTTKRLTALSVRNQVGTGEDTLIAGFVIAGDAPKRVIVRGVGPGMAATVSGYLRDPYLRVQKYDTATKVWSLVGENDDWDHTAETAALFASVGMTPPLGSDSKDAALVLTLEPGIYTAQVSGVGNTTGVGLAEIYEAP